MNNYYDAGSEHRAWADYKPSLRDRITEFIGRSGYAPPEWVDYADAQYRHMLKRVRELESQMASNPFAEEITEEQAKVIEQLMSGHKRKWSDFDDKPLNLEAEDVANDRENDDTDIVENFTSFAFGLEEYSDHYLLFDDTNFPPSRINKPANPAVINEMIAARVNERAQVVANHLAQVVFEAEVRNKLVELLSECVSSADVNDLTDAVLDKFDVRYRAKFPEWMGK